jgi:hypothetical protein
MRCACRAGLALLAILGAGVDADATHWRAIPSRLQSASHHEDPRPANLQQALAEDDAHDPARLLRGTGGLASGAARDAELPAEARAPPPPLTGAA